MNFEKIAERYGVTLQQAQALRQYVDEQVGIDWSEASYAEIDSAIHKASCALFNCAARTQEQRAANRAGMTALRAKLVKAHTAALNGLNPDVKRKDEVGTAARRYHKNYIADVQAAQRKLGEI